MLCTKYTLGSWGSGAGLLVTYLLLVTGSPLCSHCTNTSAGAKPFTRQVTEADSRRLSCSRVGGSRYTDGGFMATAYLWAWRRRSFLGRAGPSGPLCT
ncbi:TPA: hypothetical protein BOS_97 [Bos taurus]|nr:TPA: hypothetical protein BOS_97 [Bos taurus]